MTKSPKIRLYVADDHILFRKGLIRLIQSFPRISEIKEATNGRDLIRLVSENPPDVVLVDLHMPIMGGDEVCKWMEKNFPDVKVVMLTMEDAHEYVQQLISMGAHAYVSKGAAPDEVERAIYSVHDNDFYHNDLVAQALRNFAKRTVRKKGESTQFTERELDVIQLICEEFTMREIANKLALSESTIQNHRVTIMNKMRVKNTAGLVKFAFTKGLIR